MKPLMYGYLRRLPGMDDAAEACLIAELAAFTETEGFTLGGLFIEKQWQRTAALYALTERCLSDGVRNVVAPSLDHLNAIPVLGLVALEDLQETIGGRVWIVAVEPEESSCSATTSRGEP